MRTRLTSPLATAVAALCLSCVIFPAGAAELRTLATTATNGLEGLDVAKDGSLYITDATAHVVHKVDPSGQVSDFSNVGAAVQVILLTASGAIVTAQEREPDFAAMMRSPSPGADAGPAGVAPPAPRGLTAAAMGTLGAELIFLDKAGKVVRTIHGPQGAFFNGIARFGSNYLIADSVAGTIWLYEAGADQVVSWFESDALRGPDGRFPGANGLKVLKDAVYIANTAAGMMYRLHTLHGKPVGTLASVAQIASPDDFAIAQDGTVYLPSDGKVVRISRSGRTTVLAEGCKGCDSALLVDHERTLVLVTHGFGPSAGSGRIYSVALPTP